MKPVYVGLCVFALVNVFAGRAGAQGIGIQAGVSGTPSQFYAGAHYESAPLIDQLRFRPNIELGIGDNQTLTALNLEFAYQVPLNPTLWSVYVGGGPALDIYRLTNRTDAEGGFNILLGVAHRRGLFTEVKVGLMSSPSVKFGVGYTFRP